MKYEKLSEVAARLNAIIENAIDGIITIDHSGIVESINPAAANLFGYEPQEVIGQNIKILMPAPYRNEHDGYIHNYQTTGIKKIIGIGREVRGMTKKGMVFPFRLSVSEVLLEERKIFTGVIHDLSKEKEAEAQILELNKQLEDRVNERTEALGQAVNRLLETNQQLEHEIQEREKIETVLRKSEHDIRIALDKEKELNELKSRFVSMASHEFRTPLSTIRSSASLIERYTELQHQNNRLKHTKRIKSAVTNLTGILNDFLSLSKLEEGKIVVENTTFNLADICQETIEEIEGLLKQEQTIQTKKVDKTIQVNLDRRLLKNIFFNLLSNAIKYSDDGSTIRCETQKIDSKYFEFRIKDEGIGIPEVEQTHLFERFFRATNVTNIQGTGLGLNIVAQYVKLLGGKVRFQSQEHIGTTFILTFPFQEN